MPTNRRSGSNGQPSGRKPKVAGLRKREQTETETTQSTDPTADEDTTSSVGEGETAEPTGAETRDSSSDERTSDAEGTEPKADSAVYSDREPESEPESTPERESGSETDSETDSESATAAAADSDSESEADPEPATDSGDGTGSDGDDPESGAKNGKPWAVWAVTAVFLIVAIVCGAMAYATYFRGPMANQAMVSAGETSEVKGQVEEGIQKLFSYDFNDTAKTEKAANDLLQGEAVKKYDELFSVVKKEAPKQQLVVNTTVKSSAVTRLQGDKATVLVFVDQHALRSGTGESNVGPAQLSVTTEKQGDSWKITNLSVR